MVIAPFLRVLGKHKLRKDKVLSLWSSLGGAGVGDNQTEVGSAIKDQSGGGNLEGPSPKPSLKLHHWLHDFPFQDDRLSPNYILLHTSNLNAQCFRYFQILL